jgi:branched-chain amino acid transport system permease protein
VLITTPVMFVLGAAVQWLFLRSLRNEDAAQLSLLVTFALALLVEGVLSKIYSTNYRSIQTGYANTSIALGSYSIPVVRLYGFVLSVVVLGLLFLLLQRTRFGRAVRATVQNPQSATLLGVDSARIQAYGFGLGTATAAAAGSIFGLLYPFNSGSHYDLISVLLSVVLLGGLGSIFGSVVGGLFLGVISSVTAAVWNPQWESMTFFIALLLVLLIRPQGMFGRLERGQA